jgi:hypothetical protein
MHAPDIVTDLLVEGWESPEHPVYHPEGTLGAHIEIVYKRACLLGEPNLIMAALIHDLFKHTEGIDGCSKTRELPEGSYWSNPRHDRQAAYFIDERQDVRVWIECHGANPTIVRRIVRLHMTMKSVLRGEACMKGGMKLIKRERFYETNKDIMEFLREFSKMDSMLKPYPEK